MRSCHSSLLANRIKCKQKGGKEKVSAPPTKLKKALLLVWPVLRNHRCNSDLWKEERQKIKFVRKFIYIYLYIYKINFFLTLKKMSKAELHLGRRAFSPETATELPFGK